MPATVTTLPLKEYLGVGQDKEVVVRQLVRAITRTVKPATWWSMGGTGSVEAVFNSKEWFLVVYHEDNTVPATIKDDILARIKLPPP